MMGGAFQNNIMNIRIRLSEYRPTFKACTRSRLKSLSSSRHVDIDAGRITISMKTRAGRRRSNTTARGGLPASTPAPASSTTNLPHPTRAAPAPLPSSSSAPLVSTEENPIFAVPALPSLDDRYHIRVTRSYPAQLDQQHRAEGLDVYTIDAFEKMDPRRWVGQAKLLTLKRDTTVATEPFSQRIKTCDSNAFKLVSDLFDADGRMKAEYTHRGWRQVNGSMSVTVLRELQVAQAFRRRRIGRWMLDQIWNIINEKRDLTTNQVVRFIFTEVTASPSLSDDGTPEISLEDNIRFFQNAQYQRVGSTQYFCRARGFFSDHIPRPSSLEMRSKPESDEPVAGGLAGGKEANSEQPSPPPSDIDLLAAQVTQDASLENERAKKDDELLSQYINMNELT
ncbi:hypothetical protein T439DRAFT_337755 [Meredithblackwellia eburnea MCA 4105]